MICITDNYFSCSQVCRVAEVQLLLVGLGRVISPLWASFLCLFLGLALPGAWSSCGYGRNTRGQLKSGRHIWSFCSLFPLAFSSKASHATKPNISEVRRASRWLSGKESTCQRRRHKFEPWSGEDPTCLRATKPVHRNYWACALESGNCTWRVALLSATWRKPLQRWRPSTAKNK